jgi:hypothetical protein
MRFISPPTDGESTADCGDVTVPLTMTTCTTGRRSVSATLTGAAAEAFSSMANMPAKAAAVEQKILIVQQVSPGAQPSATTRLASLFDRCE